MSLLLSHPSKLCHRKPVSTRSSLFLLSNGFSSSSLQIPPSAVNRVHASLQIPPSAVNRVHASLQTPPCEISHIKFCGKEMGELVYLHDSATWKPNREKKVPLDLMDEIEMESIGASHGWVATLKNDGRVCLQDDLNPVASNTHPKRIYLPPFVTLPQCQTQIVTNMAMSSSSPEDEDCIVAFKFLGPQLSFCRPAQSNSEWINVKIQDPCFFSAPVMFSKKDGMFRIPGSGGHLIGSWDLHEHMHIPKVQRLWVENFPELKQGIKNLLDSCCTIEHLVESVTTGETFLVKLYKKAISSRSSTIKMKTRAAMVFKLEEDGIASYTKDIEDLKIYLSKAEPFAVIASSFPGLHKNSIELSDADERDFFYLPCFQPRDSWIGRLQVPYFIPPQNCDEGAETKEDSLHH